MATLQQPFVTQTVDSNDNTATSTGGPHQPMTVAGGLQQESLSESSGPRYPRWSYLVFAIGFFLWHLAFSVVGLFTLTVSLAEGLGLLLPSLIVCIWLIMDSTVHCTNPGTGMIRKACCCQCGNFNFMFIAIAIVAALRLVFWCVAMALAARDFGDYSWYFISFQLTMACYDVGGLILLTIDWYWYYGKRDFDALFGHKVQPLRCIVGLSTVSMLISVAFALYFNAYISRFVWPWIVHAILFAAVLVFAVVANLTDSVKEATVKSVAIKYIASGFVCVLAILALIVWISIFMALFSDDVRKQPIGIAILIGLGLLYSTMIAPNIGALLSFQVSANAASQQPAAYHQL